jgi:RimJ/RimL family protein N-acetyltransferase
LTLAKVYQGSGYGKEACMRLLSYLFDDLKKRRVIACTDVLNHPAYSLLERQGFRREAHFIENLWFKGRWASEYWYGMLQREWEALKQ